MLNNISNVTKGSKCWDSEELLALLKEIELLFAGVKLGIYDAEIIKSLYGVNLCGQWKRWWPVVLHAKQSTISEVNEGNYPSFNIDSVRYFEEWINQEWPSWEPLNTSRD